MRFKPLAGPLQCMKYRAMLAYKLKLPVGEVRCILAVHEIASEVKSHCADFGIEIAVVDRPTVKSTQM